LLRGDIESLGARMDRSEEHLLAADEPEGSASLSTATSEDLRGLAFPEATRRLDELLILCASSLAGPYPGPERSDLALLLARPREGTARILPQDWFNAGGYDYGYQWVTRVARDPRTGRIHGDGIRIGPFVLDASLRRLAR
jgi:hypothetical protein